MANGVVTSKRCFVRSTSSECPFCIEPCGNDHCPYGDNDADNIKEKDTMDDQAQLDNYEDIHQAYLATLRRVYSEYEFKSAPRGKAIREILDYKFTVEHPVAEPLVTKDKDRNSVIAQYTKKECELYDSMSNRVEDFAKASKFWEHLANQDGTVNSAYGYLIWKKQSVGNSYYETGDITKDDVSMRTPWDWAKQSLIADKDSRQAILRFSLPEHQWVGNKDFVCTMHGNFSIREDQLHLCITMRSNDVVKGLAYDLPWFVSLMDRMVDELKPTYPKLKKGRYTHIAHSMHMYVKDEEVIEKMLGFKKVVYKTKKESR